MATRHLAFRLYYIRDVAPAIGLSTELAAKLASTQHKMLRAIFQGKRTMTVPRATARLLVDYLTITGSKLDLHKCIEAVHSFEKKGLNEIALAVEGDPSRAIRILGKHLIPTLDQR